MTRNQQIICLAVAMLASWPGAAEAATVVETVPSPISLTGNGSVTFNFADVVNANQFVSASGGSVFAGEGGDFAVAVNYVGGSSFTLFTGPIPRSAPFDLTSLAATAFPVGTINGLTFTTSPGASFGFGENLNIRTGTTFTFSTLAAAVPEPASWAMMLMGFGAMGYAMRRRRYRITAAA